MNKHESDPTKIVITLEPLHAGQVAAQQAFKGHRFRALRCGRRFGKTQYGQTWIADALIRGFECGWFSPQHMASAEVFSELRILLAPLLARNSRSNNVIELTTGGRLDFWTLENPNAGRSRRYRRLVIDEAAFGKDGDNKTDGSMMSIWEKAIKPTLFDHSGAALVASNSAGKKPDNFFYNICTDPKYGFVEFHATTLDNPTLPKPLPGESLEAWNLRREAQLAALANDNDPLVYAQEYLAEFVDWSGVAFFGREKLLQDGASLPYPEGCDGVYAVVDTASKTGTEHDATAVTYFALDHTKAFPLVILDWDVVQIEGALLEAWLPLVFQRLNELAQACKARRGAVGAWIEDQNSGTILLQQALRRGWSAHPIDSKLTAMGKDERAISVSGYVHRGRVKYTDQAFSKVMTYKQKSRNHLVDQIESFRIGDKDSKREDDLLDTFCYGIAIGLGNSEGF